MKKGKIIVFEGLDSSFKETNAKRLVEHLTVLGKKTALFSFPRYGNEASYFVKEYLKGSYGKNPGDVGPEVSSVFYMIDMYDAWKKDIEPLYNQGYIIVMDRFWHSNIFHQLGKVFNSVEILESAELQPMIGAAVNAISGMATDLFKLPNPDHIFLMRMDFDIMIDLLKKKNSVDDIHESKVDYLIGVYNFYNTFQQNKAITNIQCTTIAGEFNLPVEIRDKEDIFSDILKVVEDRKLHEFKEETSVAVEAFEGTGELTDDDITSIIDAAVAAQQDE